MATHPQDLTRLLTLAGELMCVTTLDGRFIAVNRAFTSALGWSEDKIANLRFLDLVHPSDRDETSTAMVRVRAPQDPLELIRVENRCRTSSGSYLSLQWRAVAFPDDGRIYAVARESEDPYEIERKFKALTNRLNMVTARLRNSSTAFRKALERRTKTEAEFKRLHGMVSTLFDTSPDGLIVVDDSRRIEAINSSAEELFEYQSEELLGQSVEILLPEGEREKHAARVGEYMKAPQPRSMGTGLDLWGRKKDGTTFPVDVSLSPFEGPSGLRFLATVRDLTRRRELERQFYHAQKMDGLGRLAGGVAHDFNNFLTVILANCDRIVDLEDGSSSLKECVSEMRRAAQGAARVTRELLMFSRRNPSRPEPTDLNLILEEMQKMLNRFLRDDIAVSIQLGHGLPRIKLDRGKMQQVVLNLVINAQDAMPDGGSVHIETRVVDPEEVPGEPSLNAESDPWLLLTFTDTGSGIDSETKNKIFDPFFTTKAPGHGTGLGLSTVYGIIKQANGHIRVQSERGKGTTFLIYLPASDSLPGAGASESHEDLGVHLNGSETILVVEDDDDVRKSALRILESQGYRALGAGDPDEAIRMWEAEREAVDLIVTDVVLSHTMRGPDLVAALRETCSKLRAVYVSAFAKEESLTDDELSENDWFLEKPFGSRDILTTVRRALDRPSS